MKTRKLMLMGLLAAALCLVPGCGLNTGKPADATQEETVNKENEDADDKTTEKAPESMKPEKEDAPFVDDSTGGEEGLPAEEDVMPAELEPEVEEKLEAYADDEPFVDDDPSGGEEGPIGG
ncbi:MAG: hypothetical protein Q4B73_00510 [Lachnospiraceae bacterium]|nr:hypothetical protein [Lachnospiraceae bacterium]